MGNTPIKGRILTIDDETSFTEILKQYFGIRGYDIDISNDGRAGLELFRAQKYDVALLDLRMAGLDGDEIMREMKAIDPSIKCIFITAFNDGGKTRERITNEGAYAYIEKPLASLKELENIITRAIETGS